MFHTPRARLQGRRLPPHLWYNTFYVHFISSLLGRRMCSEHTFLSTTLLTLVHAKVPYHKCTHSRPSEDEPSGPKHVEYIIIINIKDLTP
jgi:hypothetical protein